MTIIIRPLINEKSMALVKEGFYTFEIAKNATKDQVEKIVKEKFKVTVESVKTMRVKGKTKLQRTRRGYFKVSDSKKAIVKVKKGDRIAIFEEAPKEEEATVTTAEGEKVAQVKERKGWFGGPKVRVEKGFEGNKERAETQSDVKGPTKTSQTEEKKGGK